MGGLHTPVLNFEMYILSFKEYSVENGVEEEVDNKLRVGNLTNIFRHMTIVNIISIITTMLIVYTTDTI